MGKNVKDQKFYEQKREGLEVFKRKREGRKCYGQKSEGLEEFLAKM